MSDKQITPLQYQSIFEYLHDQFGIAANNSDIDDLIEYVTKVQAASQPPAIDLEKIPFDPNRLKRMEGHEERSEKSWEEIQKRLAEPPAVKGAVWVKASDRLPEPFKVVVCKYTPDSPDPRKDTELHWGYVIKGGLWAHYGWRNDQVEWLDELSGNTEQLNESPTAAGDGKEGQELLDWIYENDIIRTEDGTWGKWDNGKALYRLFASGSDELYDIFKNRPQ